MGAFKISIFQGMVPQMAPRTLPDTNAQIASNVKLTSSELRPLRGLFTVAEPSKPIPASAVYLARYNDSQAWMTWPYDVDVVRAPLPAEAESRFYWTGDGEPRFGRFSDVISGGGNDYPHSYFALGIPAPTFKSVVTPSGGVGSTVDRFYVTTFFSQFGEESAPSPVSAVASGKVDGTWSVTGSTTLPANSGTGTASHAGGVTTFTNGSSVAHWLRAGDEVVISSTTLKVLSTPTAASFTVAGDYSAATAWARKAPWNTAGMKIRLYRTTGANGTFQLVNDNVTSFPYSDTVSDANIPGDELISAGWNPPPANLTSLIVHSSGSMMGLVGNQVYVSEPYQPHAWPNKYKLSTEYDGVALASFGSTVIVGTEGAPYSITGVEPASMSAERISGSYPCLSKRSMVGVGDGVVYASKHGLVLIGINGVSILSDKYFTKDEWVKYNPEEMVCEYAFGRVHIATTTDQGDRKVMVMDGMNFTTADIDVAELFTDPATGMLYAATSNGIAEWDSENAIPLQASWKSKIVMLPKPGNIGAAKIEFELAIDEAARVAIINTIEATKTANDALVAAGDVGGAFNSFTFLGLPLNGDQLGLFPDLPPSNEVTFILYYNKQVAFSRVVTTNKAFRLPAGSKSDTIEIQVNSQCAINEIRFADTMEALGQV